MMMAMMMITMVMVLMVMIIILRMPLPMMMVGDGGGDGGDGGDGNDDGVDGGVCPSRAKLQRLLATLKRCKTLKQSAIFSLATTCIHLFKVYKRLA